MNESRLSKHYSGYWLLVIGCWLLAYFLKLIFENLPMIVGVRTIELHIPGCRSLKEKRFVIKSLRDKLRARFNVSVAEVDHQNLWQRSTIAVVAVNESPAYVDGLFEKILELVAAERRAVILNVTSESY